MLSTIIFTSTFESSARGLCFLPSSLRLLLKAIIPNQVKVLSIGQCIVSAAKPPVLFGLGVEVDKEFKQSVVLDEVDDFITTSFPGHFAQWVGGGG